MVHLKADAMASGLKLHLALLIFRQTRGKSQRTRDNHFVIDPQAVSRRSDDPAAQYAGLAQLQVGQEAGVEILITGWRGQPESVPGKRESGRSGQRPGQTAFGSRDPESLEFNLVRG